MPVSIAPLNPGGFFGPGITLNVSSDFIGAMPTGSTWVVNMFRVTSSELPSITYGFPFHNKTQLLTPYHDPGFTVSQPLQDGLSTTASPTVQVQLVESPSTVVDSGTQVIPWDPVTGLPLVIQALQGQGGGGLTDAQAQQLQEVHQQTNPVVTLDSMLLDNLTPSGPVPGPVSANLGAAIWGVIVRIANVPPELVADTPDGNYWFPSLAVVRIYRCADLWKRVPVHTSSKIVALADDNVPGGVVGILTSEWLLQISIQVTFRQGVTGSVFLMRLP